MSKTLIINENSVPAILKEEFDKQDFMDILKRDKDAEKRIKEIVAEVINELFRVLYQRRSMYDSDLKR